MDTIGWFCAGAGLLVSMGWLADHVYLKGMVEEYKGKCGALGKQDKAISDLEAKLRAYEKAADAYATDVAENYMLNSEADKRMTEAANNAVVGLYQRQGKKFVKL